MNKSLLLLLTGTVLAASYSANAQSTIAKWTFETSAPVTAGPFNPEVGAGSASGSHVGAAAYSSPGGNGSAKSFSANTWAIGDYWQFQVSTTGYTGGYLTLSFDQTGSSTGPKTFQLEYSTDGTSFNNIGSAYNILVNGTPNTAWTSSTVNPAYTFAPDLSSLTSLANLPSVYFRMVDTTTNALNGAGVATAGTDRLDNVTIGFTLTPVPEPSTIALLATGIAGLCVLRFRK